jgi:hypothetical protein
MESEELKLEIALTASMLVAGFGGGLCGEEIPQIDIGVMWKYWKEAVDYERKPHVPLVLAGQFKGMTGKKLYIQPLSMKSATGIGYHKWLSRCLMQYEKFGITSGPMFRVATKNGPRWVAISDLNGLFRQILRKLQVYFPKLILADCNIEEEFSVKRSLRHRAMTEAQNKQLSWDVIEANNRWRKFLRSAGVLPALSMIECYTDAKASVELLVLFLFVF